MTSPAFTRKIRWVDTWGRLGLGLVVALSLGTAHGCRGDAKGGDSESHFVRCATDETCLERGEAYRCVAGECRVTSGDVEAGTGGAEGTSSLRNGGAGGVPAPVPTTSRFDASMLPDAGGGGSTSGVVTDAGASKDGSLSRRSNGAGGAGAQIAADGAAVRCEPVVPGSVIATVDAPEYALVSGAYLYGNSCQTPCAEQRESWRIPLPGGGQPASLTDASVAHFTVTDGHTYFFDPDGAVDYLGAPGGPVTAVWTPAHRSSRDSEYIAANGSDLYWTHYDTSSNTPAVLHASIQSDGTLTAVETLSSTQGLALVADDAGVYWIAPDGIYMARTGAHLGGLLLPQLVLPGEPRMATDPAGLWASTNAYRPDRDAGVSPGPDGSVVVHKRRGAYENSVIARFNRPLVASLSPLIHPTKPVVSLAVAGDRFFWIETELNGDSFEPSAPRTCQTLWQMPVSPDGVATPIARGASLGSNVVTDGTAVYYFASSSVYRYVP